MVVLTLTWMLAFRCTECGAVNRVPKERLSDHPKCGRCKHALDTSGSVQAVTPEEFERTVASSPVPVLVDFWAPWCGPCRTAGPIVERIAKHRAGLLIVLKVNTEDFPAISSTHRIQGIPAFLVFRGGVEDARQVGLLPEPAFARWVDGFALAA